MQGVLRGLDLSEFLSTCAGWDKNKLGFRVIVIVKGENELENHTYQSYKPSISLLGIYCKEIGEDKHNDNSYKDFITVVFKIV